MTKKPTDRVTTLEKPKMISCRGETIPAEKAKRRLFTMSEAVKDVLGKEVLDHVSQVIEITPNGVVISSAHKIHKETRKHKAEPEPIIVVEKPVAIHTDHKGVETVRPVTDYTAN